MHPNCVSVVALLVRLFGLENGIRGESAMPGSYRGLVRLSKLRPRDGLSLFSQGNFDGPRFPHSWHSIRRRIPPQVLIGYHPRLPTLLLGWLDDLLV